MGLSASQARLLTLTSRLNDVQYKQQQLANTKMRFSIESEEISQKYTNALSKQKFQFKNPDGKYEDMTLAKLMEYGQYKLMTADGKIVRTQSRNYNQPSNNGGTNKPWTAFLGKIEKKDIPYVAEMFEKSSDQPIAVLNLADEPKTPAQPISMPAFEAPSQPVYMNFVAHSVAQFEEHFVAHSVASIDDFDNNDVVVAEDQGSTPSSGSTDSQYLYIDDKFLKDPNWLYEAIESGQFKLVGKDGKDINTTSSTDIDTVRDDSDEVKAKAEYDAAMNKINRKEKNIDNQMKMLDTTHSAVQQEIESVKSILSSHAEKDFNLFG